MSAATDTETAATRNTPHVREIPLIGSLPGMAADPAMHFYRNFRKHGPVFDMSVLGKKYKVLAGVEAAEHMQGRSTRDCYRSKEFWDGLVKEYGAHSSLPGVDGEEHMELRRILKDGYSRTAIKGRYNELIDITNRCIERDWTVGEDIPVLQTFQYMIVDQLGIMITGQAPTEYVKDIRITILYILNCLVTRQRPKFLLHRKEYKQAKQRVLELGDQIKTDYLNGTRDVEGRTLVDDIMEANSAQPELMPDNNLRLHLTAPYVAGLDTVANTLAACVYCILKHPGVYERVIAEVDEFFATHDEVEEQGLLKQLPLLNGAIMETMRLYPITVAQMRTANKDFVFDGCQVKEGEMLYMAVAVSHFQEEYFPEPFKFDIDRYAKPREEHKQPGAYSPYGRGPHTCLGKSMAEIQLLLSMARVLHTLDMSLPSPDYELKTKTAPTPGPSTGFKIKINGLRH